MESAKSFATNVTFGKKRGTLDGSVDSACWYAVAYKEIAMRLLRALTLPALALNICFGDSIVAYAATEMPFSQQAFGASRNDRKPILVHITAPWCPYCAKQKPILAELEKQPDFKDLVVYDVDFDTQKEVMRAFGAQKQSTLIAFHGTTEKGRSTGMTDAASIRDLLDQTKN